MTQGIVYILGIAWVCFLAGFLTLIAWAYWHAPSVPARRTLLQPRSRRHERHRRAPVPHR